MLPADVRTPGWAASRPLACGLCPRLDGWPGCSAAPGGLGVFEVVLLFRMGTMVPEAPLLAVALSYRLLVTLADLIAAAAAKGDAWMAAKVRV